MADPFVAEIRILPFNFAPTGWAFCNGQILPISQNTALFSLLGTTYGGNGSTNFALPNFQGCAPLHFGQGSGLSPYYLGQTGGTQTVTLTQVQIPIHTHQVNANSSTGTKVSPQGNTWAVAGAERSEKMYSANTTSPVSMNSQAIAVSGGGQPHNNLMPYLTLNFCIALQGIYPPRG
jgi:microcystin-dependent protein